MLKQVILFSYIIIFTLSCGEHKSGNSEKDSTTSNADEEKWSKLPEVTGITSLKQTDFVPTLESPIGNNKNIIYATSLLYVWDKVKQKFAAQVTLTKNSSNEFKLLNQSTSYKNTLNENEYSGNAEIIGNDVVAEAFFNKTLPFPSKLQTLDSPIIFDKVKVAAFGKYSYDEDIEKLTKILYYKDDDHFVLKLIPKKK